MAQRRKRFDHHIGKKKIKVKTAEEKRSRRGHAMIMMRLSIDGWMGYLIREYLVFADSSFWKIEQFLASIGKEVADGEEIKARDIVGCIGYAEVDVIVDAYKPRKKKYYIVKWLPKKAGVQASETAASAPTEAATTE